LPVSFPKSVGQLPVYYNRDSSVLGAYVDGDLKPLFPFGFGLSYTTFEYAQPTVSPAVAKEGQTVNVSVDVTNTGNRQGQEVVQLYIRKPTSSVVTPVEALRGFARVDLKPQQSKTVSFQLSSDELEIWNAQQQWAVEKGEYKATVGGSSAGGKTVSFKIGG
jgi:beta-glucosidase